jgi:hypothetical protein
MGKLRCIRWGFDPGLTTDSNGQVAYFATQSGTFRLKAARYGDIRINAAIINATGCWMRYVMAANIIENTL